MNTEELDFKKLLSNEKILIESINKSSGPNIYPIDTNNGFIIDKVPVDILDYIGNHINTMDLSKPEDLPSNHYSLAGNIENQYSMPSDSLLENYIFYLCTLYMERFPTFKHMVYYSTATPREVKLNMNLFSLWINFMKKYEFNPPHTHSGRFSFVIWYKIPFDLETEMRNSPSKRLDSNNLAGAFQFSYPNFSEHGIGLTNIRADKRYEGKICLFPAYLHHAVFPFYTSDEYRISIAGNVKFVNGE